jgi:hypothetical protein
MPRFAFALLVVLSGGVPAVSAAAEADAIPAIPAPAPAMAAAEVEQNVKEQMQQLLPQFRQLFKNELAFVSRVCRPSQEQRQRLEQAGEESIKAAAKAYTEALNKMMLGQWNHNSRQPNPQQIIQQGLAKAVLGHLSAEQSRRHQTEVNKRKDHLRQVTIQIIVARLDEQLVLTAEQRDKLAESLARDWREAWGQAWSMFANNNQCLPNLPERTVVPVLNETQKRVWGAAAKTDVNASVGFAWQGVVAEDGAAGEILIGPAEVVVEQIEEPAAIMPNAKEAVPAKEPPK